jgi:hypothetical protein
MLGQERGGADVQSGVEQRQRGELGCGCEQATLEEGRGGSCGHHDQRFRVGELAAFFCVG